MTTTKPNGYLLHETSDIVVIATGFRRRSANPKTGDMLQVWILLRHVNPVRAIKLGADAKICFDCGHRGRKGKGRTCYVRVANAPLGVWKAYRRGMYPVLASGALCGHAFTGRKVRFGAYGEPVLIPLANMTEIARVASGHTGYSHQWKQPVYAPYSAFVMASCDTPQDYSDAKSAGWRTFRVRTEGSPLMPREISCPASDEMGKRTTCERCKLCSGARANDPRKDISIIVHGSGRRAFSLIQISA